MAKGSARRARVIKAMIAFVALLAVLTFFSNTIMNMTIPKVMGSYASRGNLSYSNGSRGEIVVDNQTEIKGLEGTILSYATKLGLPPESRARLALNAVEPPDEDPDGDMFA